MSNRNSYSRQNRPLPTDVDYNSAAVVAGAWVLFYSLTVGGALMTYPVSEFVAQGF
jgi:hypothetical protein